jgi:homoserine O-acetyltransferase
VTPVEGLRAFGRAYAAWVPSAEWFRKELWRESGARNLHEWLRPPRGEDSNEKWDPEDLLVAARMWQAGNIGDVAGKGDFKEGLREITAKVLLTPSISDQYFAADDSRNEVTLLKNGVYYPIETIWGHMAAGGGNPADAKFMDGKIDAFLRGELI